MKKTCLVIVLIGILSLTGCIKHYEYTEEDADLFAEYMAGLLLSYDRDYAPTLISYDEIKDYRELPEQEDVVRQTPIATPTPAPTPTSGGNINPSNNMGDNDSGGKDKYTINDIIAADGFDIQYEGFKLQSAYPENFMEEYFSITPKEGNQLLIVKFFIKNITGKDKTIDFLVADVTYQLNTNDRQSYKPMLTLLENDLQHMKLSIEAEEVGEALLIFEVAKGLDMNEAKLVVSKGDKSNIIILD